VLGSGLLRIPADTYSAVAEVYVNWTALPAEAILGIGLQLTPIDNAEVPSGAENVTSVYVYGTTYGTCPAGTIGPWQAPDSDAPGSGDLALAPIRNPSTLPPSTGPGIATGGAPAGQPGSLAPPPGPGGAPLKNFCNGARGRGGFARPPTRRG
jgi:hypothetical protein